MAKYGKCRKWSNSMNVACLDNDDVILFITDEERVTERRLEQITIKIEAFSMGCLRRGTANVG